MKVAKFGGSSLADAVQIRKVAEIVRADKERTHIVVSAPGKRFPEDRKITDLLYEWHRRHSQGFSSSEVKELIFKRFDTIIAELGLLIDLHMEIDQIERLMKLGYGEDFVASRGEYLNAKIMAEVLDYDFADAIDYVEFDEQGRLTDRHIERMKYITYRHGVVMPGFYGALPNGQVKTFSRGGSDLTGALMAAALGASVYENWTDVSGMLMADPRIVGNPKSINTLSYRELRELSYMGASVFHEEAMFPVVAASIPTNIRNTNDPGNYGTLIVPELSEELAPDIITGVAGKKGFRVIKVEKALMNQEIGFMRRLLTVLEEQKLSVEHVPSGIDSVSAIVAATDLANKQDTVVAEINRVCQPDLVQIEHELALIAIVGRRMAHTVGVAAKACAALAEAGINLRMIDQGSSEINIIIGVDEKDFEFAIRAVYGAFVTS